jgi:prepilin-type N-terminal cleavage/methylation domain-containing protein
MLAIGAAMNGKKVKFRRNREQGFSLIELMFAVGVLAVAMLGALAMIVIGIGRNGSNRMDSAATNVAQTVLEQIAGVPAANNSVLTFTDCTGANLLVTTTPGGAALIPTDQPSGGDIDWKAAAVPGYDLNYTVCNNGIRTVYEVRWNIQVVPNGWAKEVVVSARQPLAVRRGTQYSIPPATLRTVVI